MVAYDGDLYHYVFFKESPKIVPTPAIAAPPDLFLTCFLELFAKPTATATHAKSGGGGTNAAGIELGDGQ